MGARRAASVPLSTFTPCTCRGFHHLRVTLNQGRATRFQTLQEVFIKLRFTKLPLSVFEPWYRCSLRLRNSRRTVQVEGRCKRYRPKTIRLEIYGPGAFQLPRKTNMSEAKKYHDEQVQNWFDALPEKEKQELQMQSPKPLTAKIASNLVWGKGWRFVRPKSAHA